MGINSQDQRIGRASMALLSWQVNTIVDTNPFSSNIKLVGVLREDPRPAGEAPWEAFIDQGPDQGTKVWGVTILAGNDRVAIDAVGLALLRRLGYHGAAADGPIFAQEQIARAVELGVGIDGPEKIQFLTDDPDSASYADQIRDRMLQPG